MYWEQIKEKPSAQFKRLTGVQKKTFKLMVRAVKVHDAKIVQKKGNHRSRPFSLGIEDQVLLTLMYYREYRTQFHIGGTYGISESATCRTIQRIENILSKVKELQLPGKKALSGRKQELSVVVIDATEMPIERPKKKQGQYYSGKKKRHTLKVQMVVAEKSKRIICTAHDKGKTHDFKVLKKSKLLLRKGTVAMILKKNLPASLIHLFLRSQN